MWLLCRRCKVQILTYTLVNTKFYKALVLYLQMFNCILHLQSTSNEPMEPIDDFVRSTPINLQDTVYREPPIRPTRSIRPDRSDPVASVPTGSIRISSGSVVVHLFRFRRLPSILVLSASIPGPGSIVIRSWFWFSKNIEIYNP